LKKKTRVYMGTLFTIAVDDEEAPDEVFLRAFGEIGRVERLFSKYAEDSELSLLNRLGRLPAASEDFIRVLERALYYSKLSGGRYNPCILPVLKAYQELGAGEAEPSGRVRVLAGQLDCAGSIAIDGDKRSVTITNPSVKLDLSSIAKGYALDRAAEALVRAGVKHALVEGGGDLRAVGGKRGSEPWLIGIRDPFTGGIRKVIKLFSGGVATSGTYERFLDERRRIPHVVDGVTGMPVTEVVSSTVVAASATDADALATMLLVMGERGLRLLEELGLGEALLILKDGSELASSGFNKLVA